MSRSKKIFLGVMILFFAGLVLLAVDISRRTTFPGSRKKKDTTQIGPSRKDSISSSSPKSTP